jgi:CRISPR-associated protein Csd1
MFEGAFVHEDPAIRRVWEEYKAGKEVVLGQCLVTGEVASVARLHPSLKRIRGAQSSGASLVSFNERAYESYNRFKSQGLNAPVSEKAVFAYTTALNYLLSNDNPNPPILLGDSTVVYWAESQEKRYSAFFSGIFGFGYTEEAAFQQQERKEAEESLGKVAGKVQRAHALDVSNLLQPPARIGCECTLLRVGLVAQRCPRFRAFFHHGTFREDRKPYHAALRGFEDRQRIFRPA